MISGTADVDGAKIPIYQKMNVNITGRRIFSASYFFISIRINIIRNKKFNILFLNL